MLFLLFRIHGEHVSEWSGLSYVYRKYVHAQRRCGEIDDLCGESGHPRTCGKTRHRDVYGESDHP